MNRESHYHLSDIEEQLAMVAPALPPGLKARTLARCADRTARQHRDRGPKRLVWALVGICVGQWLTVSLLDARSAHLMSAPAPTHSTVSVASPTDLWSALQARSEMLTTLMASRSGGPSATELG